MDDSYFIICVYHGLFQRTYPWTDVVKHPFDRAFVYLYPTKEKVMNLLWLILQFLMVGSLTFGGGMVAITLLYDVFVLSGVISESLYVKMITIAESTPGPIAINLATYLGVDQFGILGGVLTTLSFISPSILIIWILYPLYKRFAHSPYIQQLMTVLRAVVFGLITIAVVRMALTLFEDLQQAPIQTVGLLILTLFFLPNLKNRPYILLMIGAVFGILFF